MSITTLTPELKKLGYKYIEEENETIELSKNKNGTARLRLDNVLNYAFKIDEYDDILEFEETDQELLELLESHGYKIIEDENL